MCDILSYKHRKCCESIVNAEMDCSCEILSPVFYNMSSIATVFCLIVLRIETAESPMFGLYTFEKKVVIGTKFREVAT